MDKISQLLLNASSQNQIEIKLAEEELKTFETTPWFYSTLQDIYRLPNVSEKVRFMAIVFIKNGIDKYWRKGSPNMIMNEEKIKIKEMLLDSLIEPNKMLATHQALVIAKIARLDFPNEWPTLLDTLILLIQKYQLDSTHSTSTPTPPESALVFQNILYTMHQTIKILCSKTLPSARRLLEQIAPTLFDILYSILDRNLTRVGELAAEAYPLDKREALNSALIISNTCMKSIKRLVVYGIKDILTLSTQFDSFVNYMQFLFSIRTNVKLVSPAMHTLVDSLILRFGKMYLDLLQPKYFDLMDLPSFPNTVSFYMQLLEVYQETEDGMLERFTIQSLSLLKLLIKPTETKPATPQKALSAQTFLGALFTDAFILSVAETLLKKFLRLSSGDREGWEESPESFVSEESAGQWEFNLRQCAERVFSDLVSRNKAVLAPLIIRVLYSLPGDVVDLESCLYKESVYTAVEICAVDLVDLLDFDAWVVNSLVPESRNTTPGWHFIRRRISFVLGRWITIKASKTIRSEIYSILISFMGVQEDLVVRLSAVSDLRLCIDEWEFEYDAFAPFVGSAIECMIHLLSDLEEFESKLVIVECLGVIVDRMDKKVSVYSAALLGLLPGLWSESEGQNMFRASLISILTKLVNAMKDESQMIHATTVPLIKFGVDMSNPAHIFLLDDALELWLSTIQNANSLSSDLLDIFPYSLACLNYGSENLKIVIKIVECYILLDPRMVLQLHGASVLTALAELLGNLRPEAAHSILSCLNIALDACQMSGCFGDVCGLAHSTGLFSKLLEQIRMNTELGYILVSYLGVFSKVCVLDVGCFLEFVGSVDMAGSLDLLIRSWSDKFDAMGNSKDRIQTAFAFINLLEAGNQSCFQYFSHVILTITSVLAELHGVQSDGLKVISYDDTEDSENNMTLDGQRKRHLTTLDVCKSARVYSILHERIRIVCMSPTVVILLQGLDIEILQSLRSLSIL